VDILLAELKLPGMSGLDLLKRVTEHYPQISVLVLTQCGTIDSAVEATRIGARDHVARGSTAPSRPSICSRKIACRANS
jgi:DNA-binding NtrC family response regulator